MLSLCAAAMLVAFGCFSAGESAGNTSPMVRPISSALERPSSEAPALFASVMVPSGDVTSKPSCMLLRMRSTASRETIVLRRFVRMASSARASSPISSDRSIATRSSSSL